MRKIGFSLMTGPALFVTMGALQPGYAMSFGKHNNGGGTVNQSVSEGNGHENGNGNKYGASLNAVPYQIPVPRTIDGRPLGIWRVRTWFMAVEEVISINI